jgi:hypothetical protein
MCPVEVEDMSWKNTRIYGCAIRLFAVLILVWFLAGVAPAPSDAAGVLANPKPTIAVQAKTPLVTVGPIRAGDFCATVAFNVGATSERVHLYLEASDLWHSGDPTDPRKVGPITLNTGRPAQIIAQIGRGAHGSHDAASWRGTGDPISGFQSRKTETVVYESGQGGQFNQDITCKVWYTQPTPDKTAGQYSGKVRLTALVMPEDYTDPPARGHLGPPLVNTAPIPPRPKDPPLERPGSENHQRGVMPEGHFGPPPSDPAASIPPRKVGPPPVMPGPDDAQRKYGPPLPAPRSDDAQRSVKRDGHFGPPERNHLGPPPSDPAASIPPRPKDPPPEKPGTGSPQRGGQLPDRSQ